MTKKKYVFTNETMVFHHGFPEEKTTVLHRIQAVVNIPLHGVKAGDLGGFIESEENLAHSGKAWVSGDALVFDESVVKGNAFVGGTSMVKQSSVAGRVVVTGSALIEGSLLKGYFVIDGKVEVNSSELNLKNSEVYGTYYSTHLMDRKLKDRGLLIDDLGICVQPFSFQWLGQLDWMKGRMSVS